MNKKMLLITVLLFCVSNCFAGEIDTKFVQTIVNAAQGWSSTIVKASISLFMLLWTMETFTQGVLNHLWNFEKLREAIRFIVTRTLFMAFFTTWLTHPEFYKGILQYFGHLAGLPTSATNFSVDAGWIWHQFSQWYDQDYTQALDKVGGTTGMSNMGQQVLMAGACLLYFVCTLVICFYAIFIQVQAILLIYGGLILTGCAGSKWTMGLWNNYLNACISMGLKIMLFYFLYNVLKTNMTYQTGNINGAMDLFSQIINCALCTLIIIIIPNRIGSIAAGFAGSDLGGEVIGGFMTAMAMSKKVAGGAGSVIPDSGKNNGSDGNNSQLQNLNDSIGHNGSNSSQNITPQPVENNDAKAEFLKDK